MKYVELEKVANFVNGYAFKPSEWGSDGLKIIRIQNLTNPDKPYNRTTKQVSDKYTIRKGDILVSWSATLDVFEWDDDEDALLNQHIFKVEPDANIIDKSYFKYVLRYSIEKMSQFTHGSTMKHIVRKDFLKHEIPLPSLEEQRHIVKNLDESNRLSRIRKKSNALLGTYIESLFVEMFGDPVSNKMGWKTLRLDMLGTLDRGKSKHRPRNAPELLGGTHPLIQTGDVAKAETYIENYTSTYSDIGLAQSKKWPKGTLCITIAANIAKTGILAFDACFPDSVVGFTADTSKTNTIFIHYWMSFFQKILEVNAPESAQKNINLRILRELEVITPPIELQNKFKEIVDESEKIRKAMLAQHQQLDNQFQALVQNSFRIDIESNKNLRVNVT